MPGLFGQWMQHKWDQEAQRQSLYAKLVADDLQQGIDPFKEGRASVKALERAVGPDVAALFRGFVQTDQFKGLQQQNEAHNQLLQAVSQQVGLESAPPELLGPAQVPQAFARAASGMNPTAPQGAPLAPGLVEPRQSYIPGLQMTAQEKLPAAQVAQNLDILANENPRAYGEFFNRGELTAGQRIQAATQPNKRQLLESQFVNSGMPRLLGQMGAKPKVIEKTMNAFVAGKSWPAELDSLPAVGGIGFLGGGAGGLSANTIRTDWTKWQTKLTELPSSQEKLFEQMVGKGKNGRLMLADLFATPEKVTMARRQLINHVGETLFGAMSANQLMGLMPPEGVDIGAELKQGILNNLMVPADEPGWWGRKNGRLRQFAELPPDQQAAVSQEVDSYVNDLLLHKGGLTNLAYGGNYAGVGTEPYTADTALQGWLGVGGQAPAPGAGGSAVEKPGTLRAGGPGRTGGEGQGGAGGTISEAVGQATEALDRLIAAGGPVGAEARRVKQQLARQRMHQTTQGKLAELQNQQERRGRLEPNPTMAFQEQAKAFKEGAREQEKQQRRNDILLLKELKRISR